MCECVCECVDVLVYFHYLLSLFFSLSLLLYSGCVTAFHYDATTIDKRIFCNSLRGIYLYGAFFLLSSLSLSLSHTHTHKYTLSLFSSSYRILLFVKRPMTGFRPRLQVTLP